MPPRVAVVLGSESDRELGDKICSILAELGIETEYVIVSAHRDPDELEKYVESSEVEVFVCVAGLSAALPGAIAARTLKPVVGVPRSVKLGGLDSLLSIAQMPPGTPVACVGIDAAENAALLAVRILAVKYPEIRERLREYYEKKIKRGLKRLELPRGAGGAPQPSTSNSTSRAHQ
ncbi:MAG: 5-(carboxyamino)imidazole ribonucleotide mutase [Fervidicoccaceae archaeon]